MPDLIKELLILRTILLILKYLHLKIHVLFPLLRIPLLKLAVKLLNKLCLLQSKILSQLTQESVHTYTFLPLGNPRFPLALTKNMSAEHPPEYDRGDSPLHSPWSRKVKMQTFLDHKKGDCFFQAITFYVFFILVL